MNNADGKMIARCGLVCGDCEAFIATVENNAAKVDEICRKWTQQYGHEMKPENVWCDGCLAGGRKCGYCSQCPVRACATEKELENCAFCSDYDSCGKLGGFHKMAPQAKAVLDDVRNCM